MTSQLFFYNTAGFSGRFKFVTVSCLYWVGTNTGFNINTLGDYSFLSRKTEGPRAYSRFIGTHCSFSSNSFHGQITHKAVHQLSDPENKKCSP